MAFFLAVDAVLLLIIASLVWLLVRRNRRRDVTSADGLRIESAAGLEAREDRRRARLGREMNTGSTAPYLRDRRY